MPIPTPEPPVKALQRLRELAHRSVMGITGHDWGRRSEIDRCYEEVEDLLLQRAQEIEQVKAAHLATLEQLCYAESELDGWKAQADGALVSRAPQQEQEEKEDGNLQQMRSREINGTAVPEVRPLEQSVAASLPASAALQALIEKWRNVPTPWSTDYDGSIWRARKQCADELEAAILGIQ